jgi:outer membrane protein assembly factor BamB
MSDELPETLSGDRDSRRATRETTRSRRWWIPGLTLLAAAAGVAYLYFAPEMMRDYRIVIGYITVGLAVVICCGWFVFLAALRPQLTLTVMGAAAAGVAVFFVLFRLHDFTGDMVPSISFRWAKLPDETLAPPAKSTAAADLTRTTGRDYPQFLGPNRRATLLGPALATDWENRPPRLLWRQPIGAGWSAFAVVGDFAVTQEQRGEEQFVVCYALKTGDVLWSHRTPGRFETKAGGVGPLATPTIFAGRVYAQQPEGRLLCLDGANGEVLWSRDIEADHDAAPLGWGRSGSPLVTEDWTVVSAGGANGKSLVAYDRLTGEPVWSGGDEVASYASPTLATLAGVEQVLIVNEDWAAGHRKADGELLWRFPWPGKSDSNASVSQPVALDGDRVLLTKGYNIGSALLKIERDSAGRFTATPLWERPTLLRTKMANVVVRGGYAYGLSGGILECVDLETGERQWKRGRYGHGQMILVDELLLILSEQGEVALVTASPDKYDELTRFQAIEGKTWNNPTLSGPYLLVRNHQEAACYELPLTQPATAAAEAEAAQGE